MITKYISELFGQKLPCSVYTFKTMARFLPLGEASFARNPIYRAIQIEDIKKPWSGIEAIAKLLNKNIYNISLEERNIKLLPENQWFFCQHWNKDFTGGHSYFYFRNGNMHLIADSSVKKPAQINVYFGNMPVEKTYFQAVSIT